MSYWYHVGPREWEDTPIWRIKQYIDDLPRVKRQMQLLMIDASTYPWTDDEGRASILRSHDPAQPQKLDYRGIAASFGFDVAEV